MGAPQRAGSHRVRHKVYQIPHSRIASLTAGLFSMFCIWLLQSCDLGRCRLLLKNGLIPARETQPRKRGPAIALPCISFICSTLLSAHICIAQPARVPFCPLWFDRPIDSFCETDRLAGCERRHQSPLIITSSGAHSPSVVKWRQLGWRQLTCLCCFCCCWLDPHPSAQVTAVYLSQLQRCDHAQLAVDCSGAAPVPPKGTAPLAPVG